jgi:hypothetical protein
VYVISLRFLTMLCELSSHAVRDEVRDKCVKWTRKFRGKNALTYFKRGHLLSIANKTRERLVQNIRPGDVNLLSKLCPSSGILKTREHSVSKGAGIAQSRYSDWLRAGRPRGRSSSPGRIKNFLQVVQTGSGDHPASYPMATFPQG